MIISNSKNGYSGYCNRCHEQPFVPHGRRSFKELMELQRRERELSEQLSATVALPHDFTLDIPAHGMLWLFKASITPYRARQAGIGYSKYYDRVVIPVYQDGKLVYFQARSLNRDQEIKYINPRVNRADIAYWVIPPQADKSRIVITEDILSAIRVGKFIPTMSAMGTKLSVPLANRLSEYDLVTTWLDPDAAGIDGAYKMRQLLSLTTQTSNIVSELDPKNLTDEEIQTCLKVKHG
ncbi:MAG: hypothetical protein GY799_29465 [Desulfobulbaceae bacterium]|nr:hypothetical protein [Desulfobulbaceae bacterium]